jgi:glycosyltransferase involved in cell wall biosynthesis
MAEPNKKICFISHNATRTGAPIVLYQFVKWLKQHHNHSIEVWFIEDGEMLQEFEELCTCKVLPSIVVKGLWKRAVRKLANSSPVIKQLKELKAFDLVFFNTAASLKLVPLLPIARKNKYVLWLHEQPFSIGMWYKEQFSKKNLSIFSQIFSVSSKTKTYLEEKLGLDAAKISVVYPFIDTSVLEKTPEQNGYKPIQGEPFIVGGCGLQDWRKGPDLFLQVANQLYRESPDIHVKFVWLGAESGMTDALLYELELLQLKDKVVFAGGTKDTSEWFSRFDIFLLTSREDPFPLVVLEAAAAAKPVICFDGIGDITRLVETIAENVVGYLETGEIVKRILNYVRMDEQRMQDGNRMKQEISKYDVDNGAEILFNSLKMEM